MMIRSRLLIAAALMAVWLPVLAGCESAQHVNRGDMAMQAGRPHEALASYQRAAQVDGKLRHDPQFAAKLREASWRTAFLYAEGSAAAGQWEKAVYQYEQTLVHNPAHPTAGQGLIRAKREAAGQRYHSALLAADQGQLQTAREHLRQTLMWEPSHANGRAAFDSLDGNGQASSEARYSGSRVHVERRDWQRAADELAALIKTDANHLPARAALHQAQTGMSQSREAHELAHKHHQEKRLNDAMAACKRALEIWPTNAAAAQLLARAQSERDEARALFAQAREHAAGGRFDESAAAIGRSLAIFPHDEQAKAFSDDLRLTAAKAHVAQARAKLAEDEIEAAADHFRLALQFLPDHQPARDGLVDVVHAHGQGAEKEGLIGTALLWYMEATAQKPGGVYKQAEDRARAAIAKAAGFDLSLAVLDGRGNENADTRAMQSRLTAQAQRVKPASVNLVAAPAAAPLKPGNGGAGGAGAGGAGAGAPRPLYRAMMTMRSIEIQQQRLSKESKQHTYNAVRVVPNPALPDLERDLLRTERDLAIARRNLIRYDCNDCGGRGHTRCNVCRGSRHTTCGPCNGSGRIRIVGGGFQICGACNGRPTQPCHACRGLGHFRCNRCNGRGFFNDFDHNLIRQYEQQANDLRNRLRREPPTIQEQYAVTWPYERELYRKTGRLDGSMQVFEGGADAAVQTFDVMPTWAKDDFVTINANPQVGLPADGLDLPTDDAVYQALLDEAARSAISQVMMTATVARANAYITKANQHAQAGEVDQDIEARVAAMVLLEKTHPAEAKRLLDEIRNPK